MYSTASSTVRCCAKINLYIVPCGPRPNTPPCDQFNAWRSNKLGEPCEDSATWRRGECSPRHTRSEKHRIRVGSGPRHGQTSAAPGLTWCLSTESGPNLTNKYSVPAASLLYHLTKHKLGPSDHGSTVSARHMLCNEGQVSRHLGDLFHITAAYLALGAPWRGEVALLGR